tara:strand:+ start:244 stop:567 length:324 start_codon:yes stop_codon:yes gene_type:complete
MHASASTTCWYKPTKARKLMSDKLPLKSKKFLAYLIADFGWKVILFYFIYKHQTKIDTYVFGITLSLIIVAGFIQVGYILGQAALDRYVQISNNLTNNNNVKKEDKQ